MMKRYRGCALGLLFCVFAAWIPVLWSGCAEGAGTARPPLLEALRERISVLEEALAYRSAGKRMEDGGNVAGALLAYRKSRDLYPDPLLDEKIRALSALAESLHPRPDLQPLRERIALLEELLAGLDTLEGLFGPQEGGKTISPAGPGVAVLPEDELFGNEDADWRNYPDLPDVKKAIEQTFQDFRRALEEGNIEDAANCIAEGRREEYSALFAHRPDAMPSFAGILERAEMSFLSAPERADPATTSTLRTSEYSVVLDGFTFYLRWVNVDGQWVLFDF